MLTIVTGLPGAGKTLYTLTQILKEYRGRRIYTNGIPALDHEALKSEELVDPELWYQCPEGSVIIIDEAQRVFPQRPPTKAVPEKCSQFETHRHRGLDVVLLTQDATTLDSHLRKLCGRHFHVHRLFGAKSANVYEYPMFEPKPTDKRSQKGALARKVFRHDPKVYELYKSADLHTVKRNIPLRLIVVCSLMAAGLGYLGWLGYYFWSGDALEFAGESQAVSSEPAAGGSTAPAENPSSRGDGVVFTLEAYTKMMQPLIPGLAHTAPFYQRLFQPAEFPVPYCMIVGPIEFPSVNECRCFSQQMTTYETTDEICRHFAIHGFFDPRGSRAGLTASAGLGQRGGSQP